MEDVRQFEFVMLDEPAEGAILSLWLRNDASRTSLRLPETSPCYVLSYKLDHKYNSKFLVPLE